jgi:hypothetical protein
MIPPSTPAAVLEFVRLLAALARQGDGLPNRESYARAVRVTVRVRRRS